MEQVLRFVSTDANARTGTFNEVSFHSCFQLTRMSSNPLTVRVHFVAEKAGVAINGKDYSSEVIIH
jgi:CO dehydrogenase/acetyl-CoA synthase beta subunit